MNATNKNEIDSKKDRRDSEKHRHENDNDEGTTWSMSSNGGISHDDGFIFQSTYITPPPLVLSQSAFFSSK